LIAAPRRVAAQSAAKVARIAALDDGDKSTRAAYWKVFRQRLGQLGYIEGRNITFETRWAERDQDLLPQPAAELVRSKSDVIVATGTPPTRAAMLATTTIPIVFTDSADPIKAELVASLARPAGNVTGLSIMSTAIVGKWLELLREVKPAARRIGFLGAASNAGTMAVFQQLRREAPSLNVFVQLMDARNPAEIGRAFETMSSERFDAVIVTATAILLPYWAPDRRPRDTTSAARAVRATRVHRRRRIDVVWNGLFSPVQSRGRGCSSDIAGRQTYRAAGRAATQPPDGGESENRECPWP
jgi:putative tryptophan/tyrosine transport system substrate-binding protein